MDDLYDPNRNDPTRNDLNRRDPNGHDPDRNEPDGMARDGADSRGDTPTGEGSGAVPLPPVPDSVPNSTPERIPSGGPDADRIRIGLWGAPRSGKTTYLTALPLAAMQHQRHHDGGSRCRSCSSRAAHRWTAMWSWRRNAPGCSPTRSRDRRRSPRAKDAGRRCWARCATGPGGP